MTTLENTYTYCLDTFGSVAHMMAIVRMSEQGRSLPAGVRYLAPFDRPVPGCGSCSAPVGGFAHAGEHALQHLVIDAEDREFRTQLAAAIMAEEERRKLVHGLGDQYPVTAEDYVFVCKCGERFKSADYLASRNGFRAHLEGNGWDASTAYLECFAR